MSTLIGEVKKFGKLRLVISLAGTQKYYDLSSLHKRGVAYKWICCPGRNAPEQREQYDEFVATVDKFCADHTNDEG